jgi:TolA-binding protein
MKKITSYLVIIAALMVAACGPSKEEQEAALKAHADSVRRVTEDRMLQLQELKGSINDFEAQVEGTENRISLLNAQLEVEKDRLSRIKEFQVMRTSDERESQIARQVLVIGEMEKAIAETRERMIDVKTHLVTARMDLAELEKK